METEIEPTIVTIDHCGISSSSYIEHSDVDIYEMLNIIKGSLITVGFTDSQWEFAICELANEINDKHSHSNN